MPADVTGQHLLERVRPRIVRFREGPVFTNLLLADEVNRTPPRTQAALLEAMQERQVSAAGETRPLPDPFLVVATQNPVEYEGTYPLPEAQLDRFLFKLHVAYPIGSSRSGRSSTRHAPRRRRRGHAGAAGVRRVAGPAHLAAAARRSAGSGSSRRSATTSSPWRAPRARRPAVQLGVSPRGTTMLLHAAKAWAWLAGRGPI